MSGSRISSTQISIVFALAERQVVYDMHVPPQTTAREAALMSDMADFFPEITIDPGTLALGVYGEHVADDYVLQPGDRLELYRDLVMDPMQIRRQRALTDKLARGKGKPRKK